MTCPRPPSFGAQLSLSWSHFRVLASSPSSHSLPSLSGRCLSLQPGSPQRLLLQCLPLWLGDYSACPPLLFHTDGFFSAISSLPREHFTYWPMKQTSLWPPCPLSFLLKLFITLPILAVIHIGHLQNIYSQSLETGICAIRSHWQTKAPSLLFQGSVSLQPRASSGGWMMSAHEYLLICDAHPFRFLLLVPWCQGIWQQRLN